MRLRYGLLILGFTLVVMLGYWLGSTAMPHPRSLPSRSANPPRNSGTAEGMPKFRSGDRLPDKRGDSDAWNAGALTGQRVLVFKDASAMARFLAKLGDKVRVIGRLDALKALRVRFDNVNDLTALLNGDESQWFVFPVTIPAPTEGSVQPGAVPLGNHLLDWLGIKGDNSDWGKGVLIAILDTGVSANPAFNSSIRAINLVDLLADPAAQNGHGTAVASVIIGNNALTPGVAPGADILSVRIANDYGQSDSFLLAQGIVAAVDAGAQLINISMGSSSDSALVQSAIEYARSKGTLIVAAAGNNGSNQVSYPAANPGVIAVGGVDALGNPLDFSNSGKSIALAAPAYGVNAAGIGDQAVSVTGTSFSAPIVSGSIAALMTEAGAATLTPAQAYQLLLAYLNDGGVAGQDPQLGGGTPALGRALAGTTPGIYDAAVASNRMIAPDAGYPYGQVEVLIQNRGTETLVNTSVQVSVGTNIVSANLTSLAPNAVQTVRVPIPEPASAYSNGLQVASQVLLSGGLQDAQPSNDRRVETYVPTGSK